MDLLKKLEILADAAKYDASCASSGTDKRHSAGTNGAIGSTEGMGICHAYAPDGRCISLLKILLTNACIFDCLYCVNRRSSNVVRARFTVDEVVRLTLGFYRRNCIEGLFLSSGIIRNSPDYTMEQVVRCRAHAARGAWVSRLYPPQDHSRCRSVAARRSREICRPALDQCRVAEPGQPGAIGPGEGWRRAFGGRWRACGCESTSERDAGAALRAGRAEHAGDRRRGRRAATGRS